MTLSDPSGVHQGSMDPLDPTPNLTHPRLVDDPPYLLIPVPGQRTWLLVDSQTGEVEDEFDDERLALQTLYEQNDL